MTPSVVCAGGLGRDCIVPVEGEPQLLCLGGNAAWSAMGAAVAGARPRVLSAVPLPWAADVRRMLDAAALDRSSVLEVPCEAPLPEWFLLAADGTRLDGVFGWPPPKGPRADWPSALQSASASWTITAFRRLHGPPPWPPAWGDVTGLHLAPHAAERQVGLARAARAAGVRVVSCDPQALVADKAALLEAVDVFLPSERELGAWLPGAAPADALATLAQGCGAELAVKLGAQGALWWDRAASTARHMPSIAVHATDPTGAGDAFCGGVLAGLAQGEGFADALWRGTVAASFAVEHSGADVARRAASAQRFHERRRQGHLAA